MKKRGFHHAELRAGRQVSLDGFLVLLAVQALIESCCVQSSCAGERLEIVDTQLLLVVEQQVVHVQYLL